MMTTQTNMAAHGQTGGTNRRALAARASATVGLAMLALLVSACGGRDDAKGRGGAGQPATVTTTVLAATPWTDNIEALGTASAR
jgi:multidrug efflux pump subunit AcrA (membrane-fusion protein)